MTKKPPPGRRLNQTLRFEVLGETEDGLRAMAARMKAATAIWHAKEGGNLAPLVELLRDGETALDQRARDLAADIIEGKHKRPEGRQAEHEKAMQRWQAARLFVVLRVHRKFPEKEAVARLAEFYGGAGLGTIRDWLKIERTRLGPAKWQEMEEQAAEAFDYLLWAFPGYADLLRLLE